MLWSYSFCYSMAEASLGLPETTTGRTSKAEEKRDRVQVASCNYST